METGYSDSELEELLSNRINTNINHFAIWYVGVALNSSYIILANYSLVDDLIELLSGFYEEKDWHYRIGISSPFDNVDYFSVMFSEAMDAAANNTDSSRINSFRKNRSSFSELPGGAADIYCQSVSKQLIECLSTGNDDQLPQIIPDFIKNMSSMDSNTAFNICIDIIRNVSAYFGLNVYEEFHIKYRFDLFGKDDKIINAIRTTFTDNLLRIITILKETPDQKTKRIVKKVEYLVEQNYADPNLSLLDIANTLHLSYNYLSSIIKQHTGTSFVNQLTSVRMSNAARLLFSDTYKIAEIAQAVGYNSSSYFVTVFKQYFKLSPTEYREQKIQSSKEKP